MIRVIERVKCENCNVTFGRTKTGNGWLLRRANHRVRVHGADIEKELALIDRDVINV